MAMTEKQIERDLESNPAMLRTSQAFIDLNKSNPDLVEMIVNEVKAGKPLIISLQEAMDKGKA